MLSDLVSIPEFAKAYPNLASPKFGTKVLDTSDDFFGAKERMLSDKPPVFIPDKYDDHGKWMDGWESRRRRDGGHDWSIIELGVAGYIHGAEIDTAHFTGNYPPGAMIEARISEDDPWTVILPKVDLSGDKKHFFPINVTGPWRQLRFNIYPDGGIARLKIYGVVAPINDIEPNGRVIELSALKNGGRILEYNDAHYGDIWALLSEGRGVTMGDGWETRRRREPGNDWMIIALGKPGIVERIEIDTAHFKGNFPESARVDAGFCESGSVDLKAQSADWGALLPRTKLSADHIHIFEKADIKLDKPVTHVKLNIFPDGGVSRFRVFGRGV